MRRALFPRTNEAGRGGRLFRGRTAAAADRNGSVPANTLGRRRFRSCSRVPSRSRSPGSSTSTRTSRRRQARSGAARGRCPSWVLARLEERRYGPRSLRERRLAWCGRVLRGRPDPLAQRDRAGRRRVGDGARQHAGGARRAARLGGARRAPAALGARGDPGRQRRRRPHLRRARGGRVRCEPRARRALRRPHRDRVLRASCSRCAKGTATCGARPGRSSTRRSPPRSVCGLRHPDGRPRPDAVALGDRLADRARAQRAGLRLAADLGLAAAPAGGADVRDADVRPLCSVVFAALLLDESPSEAQLLGAACILAGLVIASVDAAAMPVPEPAQS